MKNKIIYLSALFFLFGSLCYSQVGFNIMPQPIGYFNTTSGISINSTNEVHLGITNSIIKFTGSNWVQIGANEFHTEYLLSGSNYYIIRRDFFGILQSNNTWRSLINNPTPNMASLNKIILIQAETEIVFAYKKIVGSNTFLAVSKWNGSSLTSFYDVPVNNSVNIFDLSYRNGSLLLSYIEDNTFKMKSAQIYISQWNDFGAHYDTDYLKNNVTNFSIYASNNSEPLVALKYINNTISVLRNNPSRIIQYNEYVSFSIPNCWENITQGSIAQLNNISSVKLKRFNSRVDLLLSYQSTIELHRNSSGTNNSIWEKASQLRDDNNFVYIISGVNNLFGELYIQKNNKFYKECNGQAKITSHPVSQEICDGSSANVILNVVATGDNLTYQWYKDGSAINNATGSSLVIAGNNSQFGNYYCRVASNSCGQSVNSNVAEIKKIFTPTVVEITPSQDICQGSIGVLEANIFNPNTNMNNTLLEWKKDGNTISNDSILVINDVQSANAGNYTFRVQNVCGYSELSTSVSLKTPPQILVHPQSQTVCSFSQTLLTVEASGENLSYQWYINGYAIDGATQSSYLLDPYSWQSLEIYCTVNSECASINSNTAYINVDQSPIVFEPTQNPIICENTGIPIHLYTYYYASNVINEEWKNPQGEVISNNYETYINYPTPSNSGTYSYTIYTANCGEASAYTSVYVEPSIIVSHPTSQSIIEGQDVTFSMQLSGSYEYVEWFLNGQSVQNSALNSYTINAVPLELNDSYIYAVLYSANCGYISSNTAHLTVNSSARKEYINTDDNVEVYPNPNNGSFKIAGLDNIDRNSIKIVNSLGEYVNYKISSIDNKVSNIEIDQKGVFILQFTHNTLLKNIKIVIN